MKILLLLLALGIVILIGAMIVIWYLFVLAFFLLIAAVGMSFWFTVMIVDGLTGNAELAQSMGILVAMATFLGLVVWGYRNGKLNASKDRIAK